MSSGVVPHYRLCLLVWYLTIGHACWSVLRFNQHVDCRQKRDGYKSDATLTDMSTNLVPLSDMPAGTVPLYQTCMLGSFIQIHTFVKCFSIRQEIWYVTNPTDMPTG